MRALTPQDVQGYFTRYSQLVLDPDFLSALKADGKATVAWLKQLTDEQWEHRYEEGKWTVKDMFVHLIDAERIFAYRALRIGRGDQTPIPGFDQDDYATTAKGNERTGESIIKEYEAVRAASITLFESMDAEMLDRMGIASGNPISALAFGHLIVGHEIHHRNVLRERYGL